jgi:hypothetical protein
MFPGPITAHLIFKDIDILSKVLPKNGGSWHHGASVV